MRRDFYQHMDMFSRQNAGDNLRRPAFDSTDRGGFLAVAAVGTLRRDDVFDLALPFLGAVLSRLRDFAMERDDMGLDSVGSRRRN